MLTPGILLQNRYQIIDHLAGGGMGDVYRAADKRLGNTRVIVKENRSGDPQLFQREANLLASLNHPNLPRVMDHFVETNHVQYLVMSYVEGQTLEHLVRLNGTMSEPNALAWIGQIFDAVKYLHANHVIHRDIKPQNIIITRQGKAILVDFGISRIVATGSKTHSSAHGVGSPGYAPPEQYTGGTSELSDVYAFGATLYFAFTGNDPVPATERAFGIPLAPIRDINAQVSAKTEAAVTKAMEIVGNRRYQSITAFENDLLSPSTSMLARTISVAPHASSFQSATRNLQTTKRANPLKWIVIGFAVISAVTVVCLFGLLAIQIARNSALQLSPTSVAIQIKAPTLEPTLTTVSDAMKSAISTPEPMTEPTLANPTDPIQTNTPYYIVVTSIPTKPVPTHTPYYIVVTSVPTIAPPHAQNIPTATTGPIAAPNPGGAGQSRSDPAPLGKTVAWTSRSGSQQFNITLLEVHRGEAAWRRIQAANRFNKPPPPRAEYILIRIRADFIRGDAIQDVILSESDIAVVTLEGRIIEFFEGESVVPPEPMFLAKVFPGDSFDGWAAFTLPLGEPGPVLLYRGNEYSSTTGIWFHLY